MLARLPRIGAAASAAPREALPTFAAEAPALGSPALALAEVESTDPAPPNRYVVDPPHRLEPPISDVDARVHFTEWRPGDKPAANSVAVASGDPPRRYRIDAASSHRPPARFMGRDREIATISGSLFRLHSALAPHMGAIATAAMLLCAGVLCWQSFQGTGHVPTPSNRPPIEGGLSSDSLAPADARQGAVQPGAVSELNVPPILWSAQPRAAHMPTIPADQPKPAVGSGVEPTTARPA